MAIAWHTRSDLNAGDCMLGAVVEAFFPRQQRHPSLPSVHPIPDGRIVQACYLY